MKLTKKLMRQLISEEMEKSDLLNDDDELETGEVDFGDEEEDDDQEGFVVGNDDEDFKDDDQEGFVVGSDDEDFKDDDMEPVDLPSEPADAFGMGYAAGEQGLADEEPGVIDVPEEELEVTKGNGEKYGHGGRSTMAKSHLFNLIQDAQELYGNLRDEDTLPEWAQSKIAVMSSKMDAVSDWLGYKMHKKKNS
jgi:hypothetical protein